MSERLEAIRQRQIGLQASIDRVKASRERIQASIAVVESLRHGVIASKAVRQAAVSEIDALIGKLNAREGAAGFGENVEAIRARIQELEGDGAA